MLGRRGAATRVESFGGYLGGAGHRVAVGSAVQWNPCSLGGHGGVAVVR